MTLPLALIFVMKL